MSSLQTIKHGVTIRGLAPLFQVYDMPTSIAFYRDILGFEVISTSPVLGKDFFNWALLKLNGTELMLNTAYEEDDRPAHPDDARIAAHEDTSLYFACPDVDRTYQYLLSKGISLQAPVITHYGFKTIYVKDPDGFMLVFHWAMDER